MTSAAKLRERLAAAKPLFGFSSCLGASAILELAGPRWDWFWLDAQHGAFSDATLDACVVTSDSLGVPAVVRVASHEASVVGRTLDMGVAGIMLPMVETAEQAADLASMCRFPPGGSRSFGPGRYARRFGAMTQYDVEPVLVAQIETVRGFENAEAIAKVPGVDVLFFGPYDYALSAGIPIPEIAASDKVSVALAKVVEICEEAGIHAGTVGGTPEKAQAFAEAGVKLSIGARDHLGIGVTSKKALDALKR